jgi:hypothetical protein
LPVNIRTATLADAEWFAPRLREADRAELLASSGAGIASGLRAAVLYSDHAAFVAESENLGPIAIFGFARRGLAADKASPWCVGTKDLTKRGKALTLHGRAYCLRTLDAFPLLENWVDVRNTAAIRWLKAIGFKFDGPAPHGVEGLPFMRFWMKRDV